MLAQTCMSKKRLPSLQEGNERHCPLASKTVHKSSFSSPQRHKELIKKILGWRGGQRQGREQRKLQSTIKIDIKRKQKTKAKTKIYKKYYKKNIILSL